MKYCMGAIRNLYEISCGFPVKLPRVIEKGHVVRFVTDMLFSIKIFLMTGNNCCFYDFDVL